MNSVQQNTAIATIPRLSPVGPESEVIRFTGFQLRNPGLFRIIEESYPELEPRDVTAVTITDPSRYASVEELFLEHFSESAFEDLALYPNQLHHLLTKSDMFSNQGLYLVILRGESENLYPTFVAQTSGTEYSAMWVLKRIEAVSTNLITLIA